MIDHRRLQRTLLRMQVDERFAARVLAGDAAARATTGLGAPELALLEVLEPAALSADPGGRRREQILGNAASEYELSLAAAARHDGARAALAAFLESEAFHAAMAAGGPLPAAFGAHAARVAAELGAAELAGLVALERSLVAARRGPRAMHAAAPGTLALAARARLVRAPAGTLERAGAIRAALDAGGAAPPAPGTSTAAETELLLVLSGERPSPHRLAEVSVERLAGGAAALVEACAPGLDAAARAAFARELEVAPAELEAFADELVAEGVLARGA